MSDISCFKGCGLYEELVKDSTPSEVYNTLVDKLREKFKSGTGELCAIRHGTVESIAYIINHMGMCGNTIFDIMMYFQVPDFENTLHNLIVSCIAAGKFYEIVKYDCVVKMTKKIIMADDFEGLVRPLLNLPHDLVIKMFVKNNIDTLHNHHFATAVKKAAFDQIYRCLYFDKYMEQKKKEFSGN